MSTKMLPFSYDAIIPTTESSKGKETNLMFYQKYITHKDCLHMMPLPPGLLQYNVKEEAILSQNMDYLKSVCHDYSFGFALDRNTQENALRLTPDTKTGRKLKDKLELLLVVKKHEDNGDSICYKGAFRNTETNELVLMTSRNNIETYTKSRLINSQYDGYKICQCKMIAPLLFWDELKNRLLN